VTPKPIWLAALTAALPLTAPAARAAADRPTPPKCLAHAKALCFFHHPVCVALDAASSLFWGEALYTIAPPPSYPGAVSCAAPACAAVPACAPMPCGNNENYWRPAGMPPPVPVGAPMPCPCPPMPHPVIGFPGTTPACAPMTFCAEPLPFCAPCCTTPAPAAKHYVVQTKLMRTGPGGVAEETHSKVATAEGATLATVIGGAPWDRPNEPAGAMYVHVVGRGAHKVGLGLAVESGHSECGKDGEWTWCDGVSVRRTIKLGKPVRFALRKGPGGKAQTWAEVTVTEVSHAGPERIATAPRPLPPPPCPAPGVVAGMAAGFGELCGCQTWAEGMTLPSGRYVNHPPQYFPPSPAFPLTREPAPQQVGWMAPPPLVSPTPLPVVAVPVPAPARPVASPVIRAAAHEGKTWLEMHSGTACLRCQALVLKVGADDSLKITAGNGAVRVRSATLKATADGVRPLGSHGLALEGHVHLSCREMHLKADKIEVWLDGEHVKVKTATHTAEE
jgi:hypothetical protein